MAKNKIKNEDAVRVVHLFNKYNSFGGVTVAYEPILQHEDGRPAGKFAKVAVANCNPQDRYNRKVGRAMAIENLRKGKSIVLPLYVEGTPVEFIKNVYIDYDYV